MHRLSHYQSLPLSASLSVGGSHATAVVLHNCWLEAAVCVWVCASVRVCVCVCRRHAIFNATIYIEGIFGGDFSCPCTHSLTHRVHTQLHKWAESTTLKSICALSVFISSCVWKGGFWGLTLILHIINGNFLCKALEKISWLTCLLGPNMELVTIWCSNIKVTVQIRINKNHTWQKFTLMSNTIK